MFYSGVVTEESLARAVRVCAHQKAGEGESRRNIATTRAGCSNFNRVNLGGNETNACKQPEGAEILAGAVLPCPCSLVRLYLDGKKLEQKVERACQGCWGMAHRSRCCLLLTSWLETRVRGAQAGCYGCDVRVATARSNPRAARQA